jgi:hypothetical protein
MRCRAMENSLSRGGFGAWCGWIIDRDPRDRQVCVAAHISARYAADCRGQRAANYWQMFGLTKNLHNQK